MQLQRISENLILGFQRLRICDTSAAGDQPLRRGKISVIANAEIYNYKALREKYGFNFESQSDCEIFLHLYEKFGSVDKFIDELDGVFAFVLHNGETGEVIVGRDPIGVRPIFIGQDTNGNYAFASEAKALLAVCTGDSIKPFLPGHFWSSKTEQYTKWYNVTHNLEEVDLATFDEEAAMK
jgi:asparagine synthase (glutamine-hydrolysing)